MWLSEIATLAKTFVEKQYQRRYENSVDHKDVMPLLLCTFGFYMPCPPIINLSLHCFFQHLLQARDLSVIIDFQTTNYTCNQRVCPKDDENFD